MIHNEMQMESMLTCKLFACSEGFIVCDDVYFWGVCLFQTKVYSGYFMCKHSNKEFNHTTTKKVLNDVKTKTYNKLLKL